MQSIIKLVSRIEVTLSGNKRTVYRRHEIRPGDPTYEEELKAQGIDYVVGHNPYKSSAMGMALLSDYGFCKILVERKSRKILGGHIIGPEASNMIHMIIAYMNMNASLDDMLHSIYIHPALPEIVRNAARKAKTALDKNVVRI